MQTGWFLSFRVLIFRNGKVNPLPWKGFEEFCRFERFLRMNLLESRGTIKRARKRGVASEAIGRPRHDGTATWGRSIGFLGNLMALDGD